MASLLPLKKPVGFCLQETAPFLRPEIPIWVSGSEGERQEIETIHTNEYEHEVTIKITSQQQSNQNHGGKMKRFVQFLSVMVLILFVGVSMMTAQGVTFTGGPTITLPSPAANGGFAWGDVNGDGVLDVFVRQNNVLINNILSFSPLPNNGLPGALDAVGVAFADFNGDGRPDVFEVTQGTVVPTIWLDNGGGTYVQMTATGDLATAGALGNTFCGISAGDIDHSGYLSLAWAGGPITGGGGPTVPGGGIWLLKGGPSGFTNIGRGATAANLAIDTILTYEPWNLSFCDANNDSYSDLLMTSFRQGFSRFNSGTSASRKGSILFVNDGTGKFRIPNSATLGRTIYSLDSISAGVFYSSTKADSGIVVDDTVRHFEAIGHTVGDFNNDGIMDIVFASNGANNLDGVRVARNVVIVYGKGDGTFTYAWNGTNRVATNGLPVTSYIRAWGSGDYNNDGNLDVIASDATNGLFRNNGDGTFTNVTTTDNVGIPATLWRSVALVDANADGFLDVFLYTGTASALRINGGNTNNWIGFKPSGAGNNKSAIGAVFTVYTGATKQVRMIKAEAGAAGFGGDLWANFGIGSSTSIDSLVVQWPDGLRQTFAGSTLLVDRYWTVIEGTEIPATPVLASPANNTVDLLGNINLQWEAGGAGALHYQVQVSKDSTFASNVVVNDSAVTGTSKNISVGLATVYFWRVRGNNAGFIGSWSSTFKFSTFMQPATVVPAQLWPLPSAIDVPAITELRCSKTFDASQYQWQVATDIGFTTLIYDAATDDTSTTIGPLVQSGKYYWKVKGVNALGASEYSKIDSFLIMTAPGVPVLASPASNQPSVPVTNVMLTWRKQVLAYNYIIQYWTASSAQGLIIEIDTVGTDTTLLVPTLQTLQKYYWKVLAYNPGGSSAFSAVDSFTTIVPVPTPTTLVSPRSTTGEMRQTTFVWRASMFATTYRILVATNNVFSPAATVVDMVVNDTTTTLSTVLAANTRHYWKVSCININGVSAFSGLASFTTGTIVGIEQFAELPRDFALRQNYPNPFNPTTSIAYDLPKDAHVKITIYDMLGRAVTTLVDGVQSANRHSVEWNPSHLTSGVYFCRFEAQSTDGSGNFTAVRKLLYMK